MHLRIAILDCDTPVPAVHAVRGTYSDIFEGLLRTAASTLPAVCQTEFAFSKYDSVLGKLPSAAELEELHAIIITGSAASAYDKDPWIESLADFLAATYTQHPKVKLFGSCFGHQLLAHALFPRPCVERDPAGWELGVRGVALSPAFIAAFGPVTSNPSAPSTLRMQFVHADHVLPGSLPARFMCVGSSAHCALQGFWEPGRVLTYQGHAEFDEFVNRETIKTFGKLAGWGVDRQALAEEACRAADDSLWAAGMMIRFFAEDVGMVEGVHAML